MSDNEAYYGIIADNIKTDTQLFFMENGLDGLAVRVEGQTDEAFWRPLIETTLPNKALQFFPYFSEASTTTGKTDILKYIAFGDKQLIFCIDSGADYLLDHPVLQMPFVFHTYVDGIENYWCFADGLLEVLKKATDTEGVSFDFSIFFQNYSEIIYPYLLCSLFSMKEKDGHLSRQELGKQAGFIKINDIQTDLTDFKQKLEALYASLLNHYSSNPAFESFKERLTELGLKEQEAYLFVRCHDILDRVFIPIMQFIGDDLSKIRFATLTSNEEKADYYKHIKANTYSFVAQNNPKMTKCTFYQRIIQDIQTAFQN